MARTRADVRLLLRGPDNPCRQAMKELAASLGLGPEKIAFPAVVSEHDLIPAALEADVGLIPYNPAYFGYRYCCPTNLSQYVAAGLALVSSETVFVADNVRKHGLGWTVDVTNAEAVAHLFDALAGQRDVLVTTGRKARAFFEERFNWEVLSADIRARIAAMPRRSVRKGGDRPDVSWIDSWPSTQDERWGRRETPPTLHGAKERRRNFARALEGASIMASSPFLPRPYDADCLLRDDGTYAAAIGSMCDWIEIDLGHERAIDTVEMVLYDDQNRPTRISCYARLAGDQPWRTLGSIEGSDKLQVVMEFPAGKARFILVEASDFIGQQRLLMRQLKVLAVEDDADAVAPAGFLAPMQPISSKQNRDVSDARRNFARALEGASIMASSPFLPRPYDADCLLRDDGTYAAAIGSMCDWIEIDLGHERAIDTVEMVLYDDQNRPTRISCYARLAGDQPWRTLGSIEGSDKLQVVMEFPAGKARFILVEASDFIGQQRLLMRQLKVLAVEDDADAVAPAGFLAPMQPISSKQNRDVSDARRNFARALEGASIMASSPFLPRPYDADCLLRDDGTYAAAIGSMCDWIEIDLGHERAIDTVEMVLYDDQNRPTRISCYARLAGDQPWRTLGSIEGSDKLQVVMEFPAGKARFILVEASDFIGQQRLLMRQLKVLAVEDDADAVAPAGFLAPMQPISSKQNRDVANFSAMSA